MKNRKLFIFNIIMITLFIGVVFIGKNSWGQAQVESEKVETDNDKEVNEVEEVKTVEPNFTLLARNLVMRDETDFELFAFENLEITEIEEEEEEIIEELVEEPEITQVEEVQSTPQVDTNQQGQVTRNETPRRPTSGNSTGGSSTTKPEKPKPKPKPEPVPDPEVPSSEPGTPAPPDGWTPGEE